MRQTLAFLEWQAEWWKEQGNNLTHIPNKKTCEGLVAYQERQAATRIALRQQFQDMWKGVPSFLETERAELAVELERIKMSMLVSVPNGANRGEDVEEARLELDDEANEGLDDVDEIDCDIDEL